MQKQRSARSSLVRNKLYINENNLNVTGEKIRLLRFPEVVDAKSVFDERAPVNRQPPPSTANGTSKRIIGGESEERVPKTTSERRFYRLATTNYENPHACHSQLKEIYESVQVGDFKRIIKTLGPKSTRNAVKNTEITCVNPSVLYRDFFENHCDVLRDAIAKQKETQ